MKKNHLRRTVVAVATALACLMALGNPAAASATYHVDITTGVVTLTKTGMTPEVIDFAPTTPSCTDTSTQVQTTSTTTSSTIIFTTINSSHIRTFSTTGTFLAVLTRSTTGNIAGHINSDATPHTITSLRVAIVITIYNTTGCTPTGTPICTLAVLLHLNGTSTSLSNSTNFTVTGSSVGTVVAFPTCATGPSYLIGSSSSTTTALTGHLSSL